MSGEAGTNDLTAKGRSAMSEVAWLLAGLAFLWPAPLNGFPFVFYDMISYVSGANFFAHAFFDTPLEWTEIPRSMGRSVYYGAFLWLSYEAVGFWAAAALTIAYVRDASLDVAHARAAGIFRRWGRGDRAATGRLALGIGLRAITRAVAAGDATFGDVVTAVLHDHGVAHAVLAPPFAVGRFRRDDVGTEDRECAGEDQDDDRDPSSHHFAGQ